MAQLVLTHQKISHDSEHVGPFVAGPILYVSEKKRAISVENRIFFQSPVYLTPQMKGFLLELGIGALDQNGGYRAEKEV